VGDRIPAWVNPYIPEANIENVTAGMRLGIYALDSNGRVIAFSDHVLSASEIAAAAPPIESFEVLPVNEDRVTAITNLSHPGTSSYVIYVQAGPFATPLVGDSPPAGAVPYDEEAEINEITGVDAGWHLGIFALDLEGKIIAFSDHELVAFVQVSNITGVPTTAFVGIPLTLTGTVQPDNATNQAIVWSVTDAGTTGATIAGNTLSTTAAGTAIVTATIVNGSEPGIDYTQAFEIEVREFELDPAPPLTTVTAEPGTIANSTRLTNLNYDGAVSYAVCILGDFYAHPNVGDSIPAGVPAYNLGDNITDVTAGTRLGIYALDSDGKVIAFSDPELAASEIAAAAPPIESFEVLPVNDGVTKITDLSHTDAVSYAVCVRDSAFDTPLVGDSPPGDAVPYDAAEAQLINDVEEGQHLGIFALDSENKIIAFSDYVLEAWQE
jgi:hypothetical protein